LSMRQAEQIAALTARIKELQEALEKILLCSDAPSCHRIVEHLQAELKQWRDSRDGVMSENEALALKVQELEESRDEWKRQWQLTEARNKAAEDRIKELEYDVNLRNMSIDTYKHADAGIRRMAEALEKLAGLAEAYMLAHGTTYATSYDPPEGD
jgi:chromosome segregation ATPase